MTAREQIAEALPHTSMCGIGFFALAGSCTCLRSRLQAADALMPLVDRLRAEASAEAYEAAEAQLIDAFSEGASAAGTVPGWLRARAATLRAKAGA